MSLPDALTDSGEMLRRSPGTSAMSPSMPLGPKARLPRPLTPLELIAQQTLDAVLDQQLVCEEGEKAERLLGDDWGVSPQARPSPQEGRTRPSTERTRPTRRGQARPHPPPAS